MCLIVMLLLFHGDLSNKQWWSYRHIIKKYLHLGNIAAKKSYLHKNLLLLIYYQR